MTRRTDTAIPTKLWASEKFTSLPAVTQHLYLLLRTQPGVSVCGLLTAAPDAWAAMCNPPRPLPGIYNDLNTLTEQRFITSSPGTREVLIRGWISDMPPTSASEADTFRWAVREVQSPRIRSDVTADLITVMQLNLTRPVRARLADVVAWLEHGSRREVEPAGLFTTDLAAVATPKPDSHTDTAAPPIRASTSLAEPVSARTMTAWWIDEYRTRHAGGEPSGQMIGLFSRNARKAIESGRHADDDLREAAVTAGKRGVTNLDRVIETRTRVGETRVSYQHTVGEEAGSQVLDLVALLGKNNSGDDQ